MGGGKGGGGSGGSSSGWNYSSTQIPSWLEGPSSNLVARADTLSNRAYDPYSGQIVASPNQDTLQAYQQIRDMQGAANPAFSAAQNAWGGVLGNLQGLTPEQQLAATNQLYGNYGKQVIDPAQAYLQQAYGNSQQLYGTAYQNAADLYGQSYANAQGLLGGLAAGGPATAQEIGANTQALMSPYTQSVMDPTRVLGQQALAQNLAQVGAGANQAGAFGGSRQGVMEGVAQSQAALTQQQYLGNLLNTGWNTALTPATQAALQRGQEAYGAQGTLAQMGQQAATNLGQMGGTFATNLGQFGQTAASALQNMLQGGYTNAQAAAQNIQNQNLQLGQNAAQQIPALALQQQQEAQKEASLMQTIGAAQQNQTQQEINAQMALHDQAQNYPWQNLDQLAGLIGSVPYSSTSISYGQNFNQQNQSRNIAGGILGGAATGAAIGSMIPGVGTAIGAVGGGILGAL